MVKGGGEWGGRSGGGVMGGGADLEEDQSAINQIVSATPLHSDSDTDGEGGE